MNVAKASHTRDVCNGLCLVELILASGLGMMIAALVMRLVIMDTTIGGAMAQYMRHKSQQRQALTLIQDDLASAHHWQVNPIASPEWPCALKGRRPVLAIATTSDNGELRRGVIVYSVGAAPSPIWRGSVLMRCGPAYDINGQSSLKGGFMNRVLLDALPEQDSSKGFGFVARPDLTMPVLHLHVEQHVAMPNGRLQSIHSDAAA